MTTTADAVLDQEPDDIITDPVSGRRAIWPDPKKMHFTLDRRDPFSTEVRHDSLKRRHDDE